MEAGRGNSRRRAATAAILLLAGVLVSSSLHAQPVLFQTGFEFEEGYQADSDLTGQNGWLGSGADGILTNFFGDFDQQAYIGFNVPQGSPDDFHYVLRPINFVPGSPSQSIVRFSVTMQIVDSSSSNGPWDNFRWSVYNTNGTRLFSLDFDNASLEISYILDDTSGFIFTDRKFDTLGHYELEIEMDFQRNLWSAALNDEVVVNAKPITTIGSPLNLGDIDAVWSLRDPSHPGDNYMVFDDYTVSAAGAISPRLESVGIGPSGAYHSRLYAVPGTVYSIEASTDLIRWQPMLTVTTPADGILEFQDSTAPSSSMRFYRVRSAGGTSSSEL